MPQNTIILFRPHWENVKPGEKLYPVARTEPLCSVAVDLNNSMWVARRNWKVVREFFGCITGTAKLVYTDLKLWSEHSEPCMIMELYHVNSAPKWEGDAYRRDHPKNASAYAQRTYWWRIGDPSIMTEGERMEEILNICFTDPKVANKLVAGLKEQLGGMASPWFYLPLAGILLVFVGAEYLGCVAFVNAIRVMLGLNQLACDYYYYEPRFKELHRIVTGKAVEKDLFRGAEIVAEILVQIVNDICTQLGIKAIGAAATKLITTLMSKIKSADDTEWRAASTRDLPGSRGVAGSKLGYANEHLLKSADDAHLSKSEVQGYTNVSARNGEVLAIREPKANRLQILKSKVWVEGKPSWMKAKSKTGYHGMLAIPKSSVPGKLTPAGQYDMGNLKGISDVIDADIKSNPRRTMYEMPRDGRPIKEGETALVDYTMTGQKNVLLEGQLLVDMGDKFLIVDKVKGPYVADLDLITRQQPGASRAGSHIEPGKGKYREDNVVQEDAINREIWRLQRNDTGSLHRTSQHGGGGASTVHARDGKQAGTPYWKPYDKTGKWEDERIVIFLPVLTGKQRTSKAFIIDTWPQFKDFCLSNGLEFPW